MCFSIFSARFSVITAFVRTTSAALGINCRGSFLCYSAETELKTITQTIQNAVETSGLNSSMVYNSGDHIACLIQQNGICLFPQDATLTMEEIRPLIHAVIAHGCRKCGSVPIHFVDQGSNDPQWGILTFNFVREPVCTGSCIRAIWP